MKIKMKRSFTYAVEDVVAWGFQIADIYGVKGNETYSFEKQVGSEQVFINITHERFQVTNVSVLVMPQAKPPRMRMR